MDELAKYLLGAAGGGLSATWAMLAWTSGRIRRLETERVNPESCDARHLALTSIHQEMAKDIRNIAVSVALIKGHMGIQE